MTSYFDIDCSSFGSGNGHGWEPGIVLAVAFGGSLRIYAGEGALQRSGTGSSVAMRFSAGHFRAGPSRN